MSLAASGSVAKRGWTPQRAMRPQLAVLAGAGSGGAQPQRTIVLHRACPGSRPGCARSGRTRPGLALVASSRSAGPRTSRHRPPVAISGAAEVNASLARRHGTGLYAKPDEILSPAPSLAQRGPVAGRQRFSGQIQHGPGSPAGPPGPTQRCVSTARPCSSRPPPMTSARQSTSPRCPSPARRTKKPDVSCCSPGRQPRAGQVCRAPPRWPRRQPASWPVPRA